MVLPNISYTENFLFANKPCGIPTHSPEVKRQGFVEYLQHYIEEKLYVCHRLDKSVSGAMLFARTQEGASLLTKLFTERQVKKQYLFITDRQLSKTTFSAHTRLEKKGNRAVITKGEINAVTNFKLVNKFNNFTLWEAEPVTGKMHQIRIHAAESGIPILGDTSYGGSIASRVMLHAARINIPELDIDHSVAAPRYFYDLSLFSRPLLADLLTAAFRRDSLLLFDENEMIRLAHDDISYVTCDKLGEYLWFSWYRDRLPTKSEEEDLTTFVSIRGASGWHLNVMENRGSNQDKTPLTISSPQMPLEWEAHENGRVTILRRNHGRSSGIFLDQRDNRNWIEKTSAGKRILNLFCYTGAFTVAALKGGAAKVVSVDTSKQALEWSKANLAVNNLDLTSTTFIAEDARSYLKRAARRCEKFDIVICDPPSFARSKSGVFSIKKDLAELIDLILPIIEVGGTLLLSTNYEGWTLSELEVRVKDCIKTNDFSMACPQVRGWDYEIEDEEATLKSIMIEASFSNFQSHKVVKTLNRN